MNNRYTIQEEGFLKEYQSYGTLIKDSISGLELYHVETKKDREFFFVYTFATPATDSSGVAHILEHSVFSGSQRYPQQDPFLELLKRSAASFLNAFTDLDHTSYPGASPIKKDFYSLFSVYTDAIFFPLLREETFMQEGVRVEEGADGTLRFDGVVFNEMLGATSSLGGITARGSVQSLLPNSCYSYNSGGDPLEIPNLTWQGLKDFHAKWYTPGNCKLMIYGDISLEEALAMVESELLDRLSAESIAQGVEQEELLTILNKRDAITQPEVVELTAPLDDSSPEGRGIILLNWLTTPMRDRESLFILDVLTEYLLGNPGAPLYKAIIQSGLGKDIYHGSGMTPEYGDLIFSVGIEGTSKESREQAEHLILGELERLVQQGVDLELLDGAIRNCEFHRKERKGGMPQGLRMHFRAIRGWLRGYTPAVTMLIEEEASRVITKIRKNPSLLIGWIKRHLLENPQRTTLVVTPDKEHSPRIQQALSEKLRSLEKTLSAKEREEIRAKQENLHHSIQQNKDTPLAIELLSRSDIDAPPKDPPQEEQQFGSHRVSYVEVPSSDILYMTLYSDISTLTEEELRFLPLYSRLFTTSPLGDMSYDRVSQQIAHLMGSCYSSCDIHRFHKSESYRGYWYLRAKLLAHDLKESLSLINRLLGEVQINDHDAIKRVLQEVIQEVTQDMVSSGDSYATMRSGMNHSLLLQWEELWDGVSYLETLQSIQQESKEDLDRVGAILLGIRDKLHAPQRIFLSGSEGCKRAAYQEVHAFCKTLPSPLPEGEFTTAPLPSSLRSSFQPYIYEDSSLPLKERQIPLESIAIPGQTAYGGLVFPSQRGDIMGAALRVLGTMITAEDLWKRVRMEGGAYGVSGRQREDEGVFIFSSYRDPNPVQSLSVFLNLFKTMTPLQKDQVESTIVKLLGSLLKPRVPSEQHSLFAARWVYGITPELRAEQLQRYKQLSLGHILEAVELLKEQITKGRASVVGNMEYLQSVGIDTAHRYKVEQ